MKLTSWFLLCATLFLLSFLPRYYLILNSPPSNKNIDLLIYTHSGQLLTHLVNPYDFKDKKEIRDRIRTDPRFIHAYSLDNEAKWNYLSSGNLPASLLYYGAIEYVAKGDPLTYRLVFAMADSLLAVLIALFVLQFWLVKSTYLKLGVAVLLGAFNPVLLHQGVLIPEDKGLQIALMIASLLFAKSNKLIWSALFMGLAISFKGMGIFVLPLCLYYLLGSPLTINQVWTKSNRIILLKYGLTSSIICLVFFIPFLPGVLTMMQARLTYTASVTPEHSSIWRVAYSLFPLTWKFVKALWIVALLFLTLLGYLKRKFDVEILSAVIVILFIDLFLNEGSLDRMNIGFLCAILLAGSSKLYRETWLLVAVYLILGLVGFILYKEKLYLNNDAEIFDSMFSLAFVLLFTLVLVYRFLSPGFHVAVGGIITLSIGLAIFLFQVQHAASEAAVRNILHDVGMGTLDADDVLLTNSQKKLMEDIISRNPADYNPVQKSLAGTKFLSPAEILERVGLGKLNPDNLNLTQPQRKAIDSTISLNPGGYNEAQKSLVRRN